MSERMYLAFAKDYDIDVRIARFHNVYGPLEPGRAEEKKLLLLCVEKLRKLNTEKI